MISKRLKVIASFVPKTCNLADIGSDHGFLLTFLKENGFKGKLLGVENKEGPFNNLKEHINSTNYSDIRYSFSDGLDDVSEEYDCVVIAGMGFDNIKNIINSNKDKLKKIKFFIIDSHTKTSELRMFFHDLGYKIKDEEILEDANVYYEIIFFKQGKADYNELDYQFGPILRENKNKAFLDKYNEQTLKLLDISHSFKKNDARYIEIMNRIGLIKKIL